MLARRRFVAVLICAVCSVCATATADTADAEVHYGRAQAAIDQDKPFEAWEHIRQSVRVDPDHERASGVFNALWRALDQHGYMNTGRTVEEVVEGLGPPDDHHENGRVLQLEYGFMAIDFVDRQVVATVDRRGLTEETLRARELVSVVHDGRDWRIGHRQVDCIQVNTEYVLPDESVQDWDELLTVQRLIGLGERGIPLADIVDRMRIGFEIEAPVGEWRILRRGEREIVYEFTVPSDDRHAPQHEVGRMVLGDHDIHRVAYVRKGETMTDRERDKWIEVLDRSELRPVETISAGR